MLHLCYRQRSPGASLGSAIPSIVYKIPASQTGRKQHSPHAEVTLLLLAALAPALAGAAISAGRVRFADQLVRARLFVGLEQIEQFLRRLLTILDELLLVAGDRLRRD